MSKLTDAAFKKGLKAALEGKPRVTPYGNDYSKRTKGNVTFRKGAINAWLQGYDSGTQTR